MSKGTHMRQFRIPDKEWEELELVVDVRNYNCPNRPPWSMSHFIRIALWEKVAKMARSRGRALGTADDPQSLWEAVTHTDDWVPPDTLENPEANP